MKTQVIRSFNYTSGCDIFHVQRWGFSFDPEIRYSTYFGLQIGPQWQMVVTTTDRDKALEIAKLVSEFPGNPGAWLIEAEFGEGLSAADRDLPDEIRAREQAKEDARKQREQRYDPPPLKPHWWKK